MGKRVLSGGILPLLYVAAGVFLMGICFDFYYDLNDDTMMLDIMSGVYSGTPDGHNMQTLYPLGAVVALCYRLCRTIPWYGLFLLLCQFGCLYLVSVRLCALAGGAEKPGTDEKSRRFHAAKRLFLLSVLTLVVWGVCLEHFVNIQYTVTAAILSATAIFLFLTVPDTDNGREFVIRNIPSMTLVVLAYQLRSEMLLLTLPYIGLAGLYRLTGEKKIFVKDNLVKYGTVLGIMLAGMLVSRGIDYAAYGSEEWKDFLRFFEARTTVYDFYPELITGEEYEQELTRLGVAEHQQMLLRNYNYGLDDTINTELLTKMAEYAGSTLRAGRDWSAIAREQIYRYFHRTFRGGDGPYSILLLGMYAAVLIAGFYGGGASGEREENIEGNIEKNIEDSEKNQGKEKKTRRSAGRLLRKYAVIWQIILLAVMRSAIWMFILLRGRDPERITHSLYLVEYALLGGVLQQEISALWGGVLQQETSALWGGVLQQKFSGLWRGVLQQKFSGLPRGAFQHKGAMRFTHGAVCGIVVIFVILAVGWVMDSISFLLTDQARRESVNENGYAIDKYCREHRENFYFEDVYSTVSFSQKIFEDSMGNDYANYDIMGGWMCGSPLYYEKMGQYGLESAQEALLEQDNVYLIISDSEAEEQGFEWLEKCYDAGGISAAVRKTDMIKNGYAVYQVLRQE